MTKIARLHKKWLKEPEYRAAYDALDEEFVLVRAMVAARSRAKLSQAEVASRMGTSQAAVARMESGRSLPSLRSLQRYADATGSRLRIALAPARRARSRGGPAKPMR